MTRIRRKTRYIYDKIFKKEESDTKQNQEKGIVTKWELEIDNKKKERKNKEK